MSMDDQGRASLIQGRMTGGSETGILYSYLKELLLLLCEPGEVQTAQERLGKPCQFCGNRIGPDTSVSIALDPAGVPLILHRYDTAMSAFHQKGYWGFGGIKGNLEGNLEKGPRLLLTAEHVAVLRSNLLGIPLSAPRPKKKTAKKERTLTRRPRGKQVGVKVGMVVGKGQ